MIGSKIAKKIKIWPAWSRARPANSRTGRSSSLRVMAKPDDVAKCRPNSNFGLA
jgi:hypothetical protein